MFKIWDWIQSWKDWLVSFGFDLNKTGNLLFLGLDGAGKTTLLFLLKENRFIQPQPTLFGTVEELQLNNIRLKTYDLGGHKQVRRVWIDYFPAVDAIVFLIDTSKRDRFEEAKSELDALLAHEEIQNCPILILGTKIDVYQAAGRNEIVEYFNLKNVLTGARSKKSKGDVYDNRPVELFMCSLINREGYGDGFRWLTQYF